jgi:hypothetical protein
MIGTLTAVVVAALVFQYLGLPWLSSPVGGIDSKAYSVFVFALIVFIYSQLPDIDHRSSNITMLFTALGSISALACVYLDYKAYAVIILVVLSIVWGLRLLKRLTHRGRCHSLASSPLFALPLLYLSWQLALIGTCVCMSHQISDIIVTAIKNKKKR